MKNVLLQGYIGYGNFGDDLLFQIAIERIKKVANTKINVVIIDPNVDPSYLYSYYPNLNIIRVDKVLPMLFYSKFDKVYYIGGGVFFDYREELGLLSYYKKYLGTFIRFKIPKLLGTKFGGIGIGIGPYFNSRTKNMNGLILSSFSFLGVRDNKSLEYAKKMMVNNVFLSSDLSIGYENLSLNKKIDNKLSNEIIICPRLYKHKPEYEKHVAQLIEFAEYLELNDFKTHWIFLQKDSDKLMNKVTTKFKTTIWNPFEMKILDFINLFKGAYVVYSSRMHSIFMAGLVRTPFVAITLHPKLQFASELFYNDPVLLEPTAEIEDYKIALKTVLNKEFSQSKLEEEILKLNNLEENFSAWLNK